MPLRAGAGTIEAWELAALRVPCSSLLNHAGLYCAKDGDGSRRSRSPGVWERSGEQTNPNQTTGVGGEPPVRQHSPDVDG